MNEQHISAYFCANPRCALHVTSADTNVRGSGDWAETPDGLFYGRVRVGGLMYCHVCAADPDRPVQMSLPDATR